MQKGFLLVDKFDQDNLIRIRHIVIIIGIDKFTTKPL